MIIEKIIQPIMLTSFSCGILVVPICLLDVGSYYFFFVSTVVINFITPIVKSWTVCNWFFSREWTFGWSLDSSFNNIACAWSQAAGPPLFSAMMKHCCKLVKIPEKLLWVLLTFWLNALLISVAKATFNYITGRFMSSCWLVISSPGSIPEWWF